MFPNNWFYKFMYRNKVIKLKADSGRKYIVEYHRSPFWTYEKPSLKLFFKEKYAVWYGQVWEVFENGGRCGFSTCCIKMLFPRKEMKQFLHNVTYYLEKIFNDHETDNV